jgi:hypothetical protein
VKATTVPDIATMSRHGSDAINVPDRAIGGNDADIVESLSSGPRSRVHFRNRSKNESKCPKRVLP